MPLFFHPSSSFVPSIFCSAIVMRWEFQKKKKDSFLFKKKLKQNMRYSFVACQFITTDWTTSAPRHGTHSRAGREWGCECKRWRWNAWREKNERKWEKRPTSLIMPLVPLPSLLCAYWFFSNFLNKIWIFLFDNSQIVASLRSSEYLWVCMWSAWI